MYFGLVGCSLGFVVTASDLCAASCLAYALERAESAGNGFPSELDDHDIYCMLPVRGDYFELGVSTSFNFL